MNNKWERRDAKKFAKRRMRVTGASTKLLQGIILGKAEKARKRSINA